MNVYELRQQILSEAHNSPYCIDQETPRCSWFMGGLLVEWDENDIVEFVS